MAITDLFFIDANGLNYPDYPTLLTRIQDEYKVLYGSDTDLSADAQDGQWVAIETLALFDTMQVAVSVYNSFSPLIAQSSALTTNVKINGISRLSPSFSQADLVIGGSGGTQIPAGVVEDTLGQKWDLPAVVNIPGGGIIVVTAVAQNPGAVTAAAGTITRIVTTTDGWQTATNPLDAVAGNPFESDSELRQRQTVSTMIPNLTVLDGIIGAVASIQDVIRISGYANDKNITDSRGIPPKSISIVAQGGDAQTIAQTIANKKSPGSGTFGTTTLATTDSRGVITEVSFFRPTTVPIEVEVYVDALPGYLTTTGDDISQAVSDYIVSLGIGATDGYVYNTKLCVPANLSNQPEGNTYNLTQVLARVSPDPFSLADIPINFHELPTCTPAQVVVIAT